MAAAYEKQHKSFEALQRSLASLAESLERDMPALPETTTRFTGEGSVSVITRQVSLFTRHEFDMISLYSHQRTHPCWVHARD